MELLKSFLAFLITAFYTSLSFAAKEKCPEVRPLKDFNIFNILGSWYVVQYYSSAEEALTYHCMRAEFGLSQGYMDMIMKLTYIYVDDPGGETQTGNMTWQIPDPRRPEHWRHTENPYKGVYNTDVIDTDYSSWMILLHCSDPESEKKFLSSFVLSRTAYIDRMTTNYLREKLGTYHVPMEYLFPVNQTFCFGESSYAVENKPTTTTTLPSTTTEENEEAEDDETQAGEDESYDEKQN